MWELTCGFFQYYFKQRQAPFKHSIADGVFSKKASIHLGQWDIVESKNLLGIVIGNEHPIHIAYACLKTAYTISRYITSTLTQ